MKFKNRLHANEFYADILRDAERTETLHKTMNVLGRRDLFFLLTKLLHRKDINRDWLFDRCVEVQAEPNGMLDLWAREHYKSTIITFGKSIQDILDSHSGDSYYWDQEVTIGIFSHTKPIAKGFLKQIMTEFEANELLKQIYPDILWDNPKRQAPTWSLDAGIVVKRKSNPAVATVEAHGLVDGQPTGKHFLILNYDDVVTRESVSTSDQIKKTTEAWELSNNLGAEGGVERYIGTRYHANDTWRTIMDREAAKKRIHPATVDGTAAGEPVFLTREALVEKRKKQGPYTFACQQLQNPLADGAMGFNKAWLRYYDAAKYQRKMEPWPKAWNYYLLCDPAGEKKKDNDYTVMAVIGLGPDKGRYLVDGIRDRLNLVERTKALFAFHRKYDIKETGYEKYGKDSDIEHIQDVQERENYRFDITPVGGAMPKNDRIRRLVPVFDERKFYLPYELLFLDYEGRTQNFVKLFIDDEYETFPVSVHDDMFDCIARIEDPAFGATFPKPLPDSSVFAAQNTYDPLTYR